MSEVPVDEEAAGRCDGDPRDCSAFDSECTAGMCDEGGTTCFADPINEGLSCDGGNGTCTNGVCEPNE